MVPVWVWLALSFIWAVQSFFFICLIFRGVFSVGRYVGRSRLWDWIWNPSWADGKPSIWVAIPMCLLWMYLVSFLGTSVLLLIVGGIIYWGGRMFSG